MLDEQGEAERGEGGVGEVDDDDLGCDEKLAQLSGVIAFARRGAGLGLGRLGEDSRKSFSSRRGELAIGGDGEQLVGEIHEDAVVAGGVVGEGDAAARWS